MDSNVVLDSVITCPECSHRSMERMPTDACLWFYKCQSCHQMLTPQSGDCCVFCSYGTLPCPSIQQQHDCCDST
ncbi:MAG: GDCCVxC domain-containing (seleno)protein [Pseudomonadota bacterium]|nr:GDCCVxC domain-containing (seleno)protein [Pseudomonadota bacterium]